MNKTTFPLLLVSAAFIGSCLSGSAWATDKEWQVQSGNTLGKIVAEQYPGYTNRQAIMQELLKRNPDVFSNKNINSLIVGKILKLPDAKDIPDLKPPAPKPAAGLDKATQEKLQSLETQVTELKDTVSLLEEENAALQEMVKGYAEGKPTGGGEDLQKQLDAAKQALAESQASSTTLQEQVTAAKVENATLQNDLQQMRAVAVIDSKASSSTTLPWVLLGLLALLTLPLFWLLRRKREQTQVLASAAIAPVTPPAAPLMASAAAALDAPPATESIPVDTALEDEPEDPDASLKLNIARAYLDLRDSEAAADILQDVLVEGSNQQRQEAREILSFIS